MEGMRECRYIEIIGKRYGVIKQIGQGSFGKIFLAVDLQTNEKVAIKKEETNSKYPQLLYEYNVYMEIEKAIETKHAGKLDRNEYGFPKIHWCGSGLKYHALTMDLLGDSLESLYNKCNRKFSLKTVLMLGIQLLERIEVQHESCYLHRDIKPDNFLMGEYPNDNKLYVIDLGLSKRYIDRNSNRHIPYKEKKKLTGTPRYASINTHHGIEQCRRDDLESLGYLLMYFNIGRLPWQGLKARSKQEKYDKIGYKKLTLPIEELCKGFPKEFADYLKYCRSLRFTQTPNYAYLKNLFINLMQKRQYELDWKFDWMKGKERKASKIPLTPNPLTIPVSPVEGKNPVLKTPVSTKSNAEIQINNLFQRTVNERNRWKSMYTEIQMRCKKLQAANASLQKRNADLELQNNAFKEALEFREKKNMLEGTSIRKSCGNCTKCKERKRLYSNDTLNLNEKGNDKNDGNLNVNAYLIGNEHVTANGSGVEKTGSEIGVKRKKVSLSQSVNANISKQKALTPNSMSFTKSNQGIMTRSSVKYIRSN